MCTGGPPPEKTINLAFVSAPKVSKRLPPSADHPKGQVTAEEPHGWATREYLRKRLVGKEVQFKLEYTAPFGQQKRECGIVFLGDENIVDTLVSEGLVDVTKRKQNTDNPDVVRLTELEEAAKAAGKGKHGSQPSKRDVSYEVDNPETLLNKTYPAIVEHVINGSTIRVALETAPLTYKMVTVMVSGIRSPNASEPFGDEARFFTESRLLQKDVQVRLESVMPGASPAFQASVLCGTHNIAEYLVREGMAKCMDRTILQAMSSEKLRLAEAEAKNKKLRIWRDYKQVVRSDADSFEAKVLEVINGDALRVENVVTKEEKKIFLASVRAPPRPENEKVTRVLYDVPFMFEAREFLRKRLIHKRVKVRIDYVQPERERADGKEKFPEKICCTVLTTDGGINVAEALIARGLATCVRYREGDEQRASAYDALLAAEQKAKQGGKGLHGNAAAPTRVVELSNDAAKAKQFLPFLLRGTANTRRDAVVEFVLSASKLRMYIPKENCCLSLILVGISTPRGNDPYVDEAKAFVNSLILQRDVQVTVEALDKVGNFIGTVYFDNKNLSVELLKAGYASIRDERGNDYKQAEDEAKAAKLRIWENFKEEEKPVADEENGDEPDEKEATKQNGDAKPKKDDRKKVLITQVASDATHISVQHVDSGAALEELLFGLREELNANPPLPGAYTPQKGDIVAARYSADNEWYRARIDKTVPGSAQVTFIDYGNKETVKNKDIAPLPATKYAVSTLPAQAKEYALAYVSLPEDQELVDETREVFQQETLDRVLLLKSEYKDTGNVEHVTLFDPESNKDVVLGLVTEGFYMMNLKERRKERRLQQTVTEYRTAQDSAKKNRVS